jgi:hypothetical protein
MKDPTVPKPMQYILEIYAPGSVDNALVHLRSAQPFGAITAGDLINPRAWSGGMEQTGDGVLRVGTVEHLIHELQGYILHQVMVLTEVLPDTAAVRFVR